MVMAGLNPLACFHSTKRMVGYNAESEELDSDKLRHYILGGHVADYMKHLSEEDEEQYKGHFARFIKEGLNGDKVRRIMYTSGENGGKQP